MEHFLETICVVDGDIKLLDLHQQRMQRTGKHFDFNPPILKEILPKLPREYRKGKVKLRVLYREEVLQIQFLPYVLKKISTLQIVANELIHYAYKYADRSCFIAFESELSKGVEIIIVQKGLVTDCSYANLVFERDGCFYTPLKPLLEGVKRQYLIEKGLIVPKNISFREVRDYERVHLINSMLSIGDISVEVHNIRGLKE